jgi:hypothetical protein
MAIWCFTSRWTNFAGSANCPVYRVTQNGTTLVANSQLGLTFGGVAWRENVAVLGWTTNSHDSVWQPVYGERSTVRDHYHELTWQLQETVAPNRELQLTFRAYDEGRGVLLHRAGASGASKCCRPHGADRVSIHFKSHRVVGDDGAGHLFQNHSQCAAQRLRTSARASVRPQSIRRPRRGRGSWITRG